MVRQGYLDKIKTNFTAPTGTQVPNNNKRPRGSMDNNEKENKENYKWRWGARALAEIGEAGMVEFITAFMVEKHDLIEEVEDDEDGAPGNAARYQERKRDEATAMRKSILKASMTSAD